jgi:hypothetical protein
MTEVVPSPTSSSCVLLSSIMFFAAGCATSISRKIAFPSFVNLDSEWSVTTTMSFVKKSEKVMLTGCHPSDPKAS